MMGGGLMIDQLATILFISKAIKVQLLGQSHSNTNFVFQHHDFLVAFFRKENC